jgi:hypothetical protein
VPSEKIYSHDIAEVLLQNVALHVPAVLSLTILNSHSDNKVELRIQACKITETIETILKTRRLSLLSS